MALGTTQAQSIITTVAGNGTSGYSGDGGQATNANLHGSEQLLIDIGGNLYFADAGNMVVRKINTNGIISTIAGTGAYGSNGDGGPATAADMGEIVGIALDRIGNLYIADKDNEVIRMVNTLGIISTIAGTSGTSAYSGDGGYATAAALFGPLALTFDTTGNLYIADAGNNVVRKIEKSTGIISTFAGNGTQGYSGDGGTATAAHLYFPAGLIFDKVGNLYIEDFGNNVIRKVTTSIGTISTVVGTGIAGYSGDGGPAIAAELHYPQGLCFDAWNNLYISDENSVIRKVDTAGIISTIAGTGTAGYSGDGGSPLLAELNSADGLCFDAFDNLYVADLNNNRIRKITNASTIGIEQYAASNAQVAVYPNPASEVLNITLSKNTESSNTMKLIDVKGQTVYYNIIKGVNEVIDISQLSKGIYMLIVTNDNNAVYKKVIVE